MAKSNKTPRKRPDSDEPLTGEKFDALPAAEKERIFQEIERETPEQRRAASRPLNPAERARWNRIKKKMGRPKIGKGIKVISLSVERDLLKRADAYAKAAGLKRSAVFAAGLLRFLPAQEPRPN
jgi:hypothetical protein